MPLDLGAMWVHGTGTPTTCVRARACMCAVCMCCVGRACPYVVLRCVVLRCVCVCERPCAQSRADGILSFFDSSEQRVKRKCTARRNPLTAFAEATAIPRARWPRAVFLVATNKLDRLARPCMLTRARPLTYLCSHTPALALIAPFSDVHFKVTPTPEKKTRNYLHMN